MTARADVRTAFLCGLRLRRAVWPLAFGVVSFALGVVACAWLRSDLDRRDLTAELEQLHVQRIDLEREACDARGALRGCKGTLRGAAVRLGLREDALTFAGGAR